MNLIIIIQARVGSSRLPGKVLMPLGNTTVLDYVVSRCKKIKFAKKVIVATSTLSQDQQIEDWCMENEVPCFRGSEKDVLDRYYSCANEYSPDYVMRVTSDCPFVDFHLANEIVDKMLENPSDYIKVNGDLPRGLVVELFSFQALAYIHRNGKQLRHREHVTYYGYEYSDEFNYTNFLVNESMNHPQLRITLDTKEDYLLLTNIASHFSDNKWIPSTEIIEYLLKHPDVARLNAHIEQKPVV
ncbi:acylneuraminate cytidylyltransferase [Bacillus sp. TS-2]|nr:acylneuraminate cytidylyltransferase [Bacillus sp. TS-2]